MAMDGRHAKQLRHGIIEISRRVQNHKSAVSAIIGALLVASLIVPPLPPIRGIASDAPVDIFAATPMNASSIIFVFDPLEGLTTVQMDWTKVNTTLQLYFLMPFEITSARFSSQVSRPQGNISLPRELGPSWYVKVSFAPYANSTFLELASGSILSRSLWRDTLFLTFGRNEPLQFYDQSVQPLIRTMGVVDVTVVCSPGQELDTDTFPSPNFSYGAGSDWRAFNFRFVRSSFPQLFPYTLRLSLITRVWTLEAATFPLELQGLVISAAFVLFDYSIRSAFFSRTDKRDKTR